MGQGQEAKQTRLTRLKVFRWTQPVAGILAVSVVFSSTALWVLFHYDTSPTSVLSPGAVITRVFSNPIFWVSSVVAFGVSYYLAR